MEEDIQLILNAIQSGNCLPFLGAGASVSFKKGDGQEEAGLPTGGYLAKLLANKCGYRNGNNPDLLKVAEYFVYTHSGNREPLERSIQEIIQIPCTPRPIHTVLSQLSQIKIAITSNYDTMLEQELARYGRYLRKHVYNPQNPRNAHFAAPFKLNDKDIVLHKMHGSIDDPQSIIITESDYIQYLTNLNDLDRGMPSYFRNWIPQFTLLFLGYSLGDWNFRVIWEGVLANYAVRNVKIESYALVKNPSNFQIKYWARRNVSILDQDLTEFAVKLAEHFDLEIPQLGIIRKQEQNK